MSETLIDVPVFSDAAIPKDEPAVTAPEFACETCGKELVYKGRGRKPRYCEDHRKGGGSVASRPKGLGQNAQLAAQATEALVQMNGLLALGLMAAQMPVTAEAIEAAKEGFREQTYAALLTDPALCKTILKGGTASGKLALVISYGMFVGAVAPVGIMEYKMNAEKRRVAREDAENEDRT